MINLKSKNEKNIFLPCLECVSIGRAYHLLRADIREHLTMARKEIGFKYCRFHALFHDDMDVAYRRSDGSVGYNWYHVDSIYDFLLSIGMKPFVELGSMPSCIASGNATMFWYKMNITPPAKMYEWYDLVRNFTLHITDRYGIKEVSSWLFEVWNEPNLECFWTGSKQDYFDLYENAAKAVKSVCKNYKVGGPATAVAEWVTDIIEYCESKNIPLDFVTTHVYPQDEYCLYKTRDNSPYKEVGEYFVGEVKKIKNEIMNSSRPDIDVYWTEFNTLTADGDGKIAFIGNDSLDRLYGGACVARNMIETMDLSRGVSYWTVSDVFDENKLRQIPFSGSYGLLTIHGIRKATYNVFTLLTKMRGRKLEAEVSAPQGCGILACEENGNVRVILYNCHFPEIKDQPTWCDSLNFSDFKADNHVCYQIKVTEEHGSPYETWLKMGSPSNLSKTEVEFLQTAAEMEYSIRSINESGEIEFSINPDEVCYFEFSKKNPSASDKAKNLKLENQLNTANKKS